MKNRTSRVPAALTAGETWHKVVLAALVALGLAASCVIFQGADVDESTGSGTGGAAGSCQSAADCSAPTPFCDPSRGACVACLVDADCPLHNACVGGTCLPPVCEPGATKCAGTAIVTCNASGTGFGDPVPCESGKQCVDQGGAATCVDVPDGGAGSGGLGGSGGAGGAGGSGGSGGDGGDGGDGGMKDPKLIDDMEDNDRLILDLEGRVGAWGTEDDASGGSLTANLPEEIPGGRETSRYAVHVTGSGFSAWSELRVNVNQPNPDDVMTSLPYDASKYTGLAFWARGSEGSFRFAVPTADTDALGGTCSACFNHFGAETSLGTDWQYVSIPFSSLAQEEGWGDVIERFDAAKIYGVQFIFRGSGAYELWVDDLTFY